MIGRACLAIAALVLVTGCGAPPDRPSPVGGPAPGAATAPAAREGRTAATARVTYVPERVTLPGGQSAPVDPAETVDGELVVPEDVQNVGWWDASASVNDAFGSTVIAGHVDSATEGLGYFARLLQVEPGDRLTVGGDDHEQTYRVVSVESVTKQALATTSDAFDQTGDHRLVLITCTGTYRPGTGYDSNLVVVAEPVGSPQ